MSKRNKRLRRIRSKVRSCLSAGLVRLIFPPVALAVAYLPRWARKCLAWCTGQVVMRLPAEREMLNANLRIAFPEMPPGERQQLARRSVAHLIYSFCTFIHATRHPDRLLDQIVYDEQELAAFRDAGGALLISPHLGNWEIGHLVVNLLGMQTVTVSRRHRYDVVERFLSRARSCTGSQMIYQDGAARGMLKGLRAGHKVFILVDQNIRPRDGGVFAPFFGLPASASPAPAVLSAKTKASVWLGACLAEPDGRYRLTCHRVELAPDQTPEQAMETINRATEAFLQKYPEQYLWWYKRWLFIPDGCEAATFPRYARRISKKDESVTTNR